jgi:hypothetical protein
MRLRQVIGLHTEQDGTTWESDATDQSDPKGAFGLNRCRYRGLPGIGK